MDNILTKYLYTYYDDIEPKEFYRAIFPEGELQEKGVYEKGKYNGIIIEVTKEKKKNGKDRILRHTLTDDLDKIDEIVERDNFCLMSPPISYVGKERNSDNARALYALTRGLAEKMRISHIKSIFPAYTKGLQTFYNLLLYSFNNL